MLKAFDHIAVPMENVESMITFYEALGCKVLDQGQIKAVVFGNNKINFHLPDLWNDKEFTLRGHTALPGSGDICSLSPDGEALVPRPGRWSILAQARGVVIIIVSIL